MKTEASPTTPSAGYVVIATDHAHLQACYLPLAAAGVPYVSKSYGTLAGATRAAEALADLFDSVTVVDAAGAAPFRGGWAR